MSIEPLTESQKSNIVRNVVAAVENITKLNGTGYKFLMLASGFIAHYSRSGFIAHYSDGSLREAILRNASSNRWDNFRPGEQNYEYYMSKRDVYNRILQAI